MLKKRTNRILIALGVTLVSVGLFLGLAAVPAFGESLPQFALFGLIIMSALDFFLMMILDPNENGVKAFKLVNVAYWAIWGIEALVCAFTVLISLIEPGESEISMWAFALCGAVVTHSTVNIMIYNALPIEKLKMSKEFMPFVSLITSALGYLGGVVLGLLLLVASWLAGLGLLIAFGFLTFFFIKKGGLEAPYTKNSAYKKPSGYTSTPKTNKKADDSNGESTSISTFKKKPQESDVPHNNTARRMIGTNVRGYTKQFCATVYPKTSIRRVEIQVDYLQANVGYSVILRYHIHYYVHAQKATGEQFIAWRDKVLKDMDLFQQEYIPTVKSNVKKVYDYMDGFLTKTHADYQGEWSVDADFAEDLHLI